MNKYNNLCYIGKCGGLKSIIWVCVWLSVFPQVFAETNVNCPGLNPGIAKFRWGYICGKYDKSFQRRRFEAYLGLPYALPPVDDLRFKDPEPWNKSWNIRDGRIEQPPCFSRENTLQIASEDCLYLNVYKPITTYGRGYLKLPVLVLLLGESYVEGNGDSKLYNPKYLMDLDMVVVTVHYRLDILGFFSLANEVSTGNYGLKDIVMALKWVQENIDDFNGKSEQVTLMGTSTSSTMVHLLALSTKTAGLFHQYILISGSALTLRYMPQYNVEMYRLRNLRVAMQAGCVPGNKLDSIIRKPNAMLNIKNEVIDMYNAKPCVDFFVDDYYENMMKCMRAIDPKILVNKSYVRYNDYNIDNHIFGPTLEPESQNAILTMHPVKILKEGLYRDIPVVFITMENEGLSLALDFVLYTKYYSNTWSSKLMNNFERDLPSFIGFNEKIEDTRTFANEIKNFYFNGILNDNMMINITEMIGDGAITWPMMKALQYHVRFGNSDIRVLSLPSKGSFSFTTDCNADYPAVCHIDRMESKFGRLDHNSLIRHETDEFEERIRLNTMKDLLEKFIIDNLPDFTLRLPSEVEYTYFKKFQDRNNSIVRTTEIHYSNRTASNRTASMPDLLTIRLFLWNKLMFKVLNPRYKRLYNELLFVKNKN